MMHELLLLVNYCNMTDYDFLINKVKTRAIYLRQSPFLFVLLSFSSFSVFPACFSFFFFLSLLEQMVGRDYPENNSDWTSYNTKMNIERYLHLWLYSLALSIALVTERKRDLLGMLEHIVAVCGYKSFQTRSYIKRPPLLVSDVINMSRTRDKEKIWVQDRNWN